MRDAAALVDNAWSSADIDAPLGRMTADGDAAAPESDDVAPEPDEVAPESHVVDD